MLSGRDYDSACILTGLDLSVCGLISKDRAAILGEKKNISSML